MDVKNRLLTLSCGERVPADQAFEAGKTQSFQGDQAMDVKNRLLTLSCARLGHSMVLRDGNNVHTVGIRAVRNYLANQYNYTVRPAIGSVPKADADRLFALFDEGTDFVLDLDGHTWIYKGMLRYGRIVDRNTGAPFREHHRIAHVLHHTIDDANRVASNIPHGVFTVPKEQVFDILHDVRMLGTPVSRGYEYTFPTFQGRANNTPGSANGLPLIPHQQTSVVRLGAKGNSVATGFPINQ